MQLQLLDHLIIGDGSYSFADNGLMDTVRMDCQTAMESFGKE
jgi:DNA repair protein RadC